MFNKTRIAPTPSGYLHIGNALSFAITAALAKAANAAILLRIDDMDKARIRREYVQDIFDTLHFLEIPWHEGAVDYNNYEQQYAQVHRMPLYNKALQQLREEGKIFACTCSRSKLNTGTESTCACYNKSIPLDAANAVWRLITNNETPVAIKTISGDIIHTTLPDNMLSFVVKKKNGYPAYQLTSVADDLFFGIDMIVRGQDLWPSTIAQHYLAKALHTKTFNDILFCHHPLLTDKTTGDKLSKSAGATSIQHLRKEGKKRADIFNLIGNMLGTQEPMNRYEDLLPYVDTINKTNTPSY